MTQNLSQPLQVKVVGLGGIGGHLVGPLGRYMLYSEASADFSSSGEISLIDGDRYEDKNRTRQTFEKPLNKAEETARLLRQSFPSLSLLSFPEYLTGENIVTHIREGDVVFVCVDNYATRKLIADRASELDNILLISGGNGIIDGSVTVYFRRDGQDLTKPLNDSEYYGEIANPNDKRPDEMSCEELAASGTPQLLFTNNLVAANMLCTFYIFLTQPEEYYHDNVYISVVPTRTRPCFWSRPEPHSVPEQ